jgi:hypothetical protein
VEIFNIFKKKTKSPANNTISKIEKFRDEWLFRDHSVTEIQGWVNQIHYFYFVRAWGGMNNDGDRFEAKFSYKSKSDLIELAEKLGITLNILPKDTPQPIPGVSYPADEFWKFKRVIRRFPDLEQPGTTNINSLPCHIYVGDDSFEVSVSGNQDGNAYAVTNEDFEICKKLEGFFDELNLIYEKDLTIENNAGCVSPKKYPELFVEL